MKRGLPSAPLSGRLKFSDTIGDDLTIQILNCSSPACQRKLGLYGLGVGRQPIRDVLTADRRPSRKPPAKPLFRGGQKNVAVIDRSVVSLQQNRSGRRFIAVDRPASDAVNQRSVDHFPANWGMHLTPEAPRYGILALEGYSPTLGGLESASPSGFKFSPRRAATRRNEPQASAPRPPPGDFPRAQAAAVADHKI